MPEDPYAEAGDADKVPWDEHRWERFLQESDRRTEKFGQLLERYQDHPDRDAIIAREMGWDSEDSDDDEELEDWQKEQLADSAGSAPRSEASEVDDQIDEAEFQEYLAAEERRPKDPLFLEAQEYTHQLLKLVDQAKEDPAHRSINDALVGGAMICAAKLTILSRGTRPEIGMVIAYAKRALKGLTDSLGAIEPARAAGILSPAQASLVQAAAFQVRSGIIQRMGDLRAEFRREHG